MGPFGDGFTETTSPFIDFTGFAGGFWDAENNSDHFGAREYAKSQGHWLTPDPAGLAAVNPANPQTWNRYAYVSNNPTSFVDPSGLDRNLNWGPQGGGGMTGLYAMTGGNSYNTWVNTFIQSQIAAGNVQLTYSTYTYHPGAWQISEVNSQIITGDTSSSNGDSMYQVQFGSLRMIGGEGYFSLSSATEDFPDDSLLMAQNEGPQNPGPQNPALKGLAPIGTPKTSSQCSIYSRGASGAALNFICRVTPNNPWSQRMRGCLQALYDPNSGYLPVPFPIVTMVAPPFDLNSILPGTGAHAVCVLEASQNP